MIHIHQLLCHPLTWSDSAFVPQWLNVTDGHRKLGYNFPDPDLLQTLVQLYFENINQFIPLLHRPTFEASLFTNLHVRDEAFGGLVLLVCACASRFSKDPRVVLGGTNSWHSSGWQWFSQVYIFRKTLLSVPCLYDLQLHAVGPVSASACLGIHLTNIYCSLPHSFSMDVRLRNRDGLRLASVLGSRSMWVPIERRRTISNRPWKTNFGSAHFGSYISLVSVSLASSSTHFLGV